MFQNSLFHTTDNDAIRPLCIKLSQINVKHFDSNKAMSFKASDNKLFKEVYWNMERARNLMNIKFDSKPVYGDNDKYIKTKITSHQEKVNTIFQGNEGPKENESYKFFSLIMSDSVCY